MSFSYLSVCSGLEGASLAFEPLGATCVGVAEIDKFAAAIIAARYGSNLPGEAFSHNAPPNFGDFTRIPLDRLPPHIDLLIGGTPCQAFSIAGKRLSLDDARGNLTLAFAVLAHELARSHGLRNVIWENVPGALSTKDNAFGCFLGALVGADYPLAGCDRPRAGRDNWFWGWNAKERSHVTRWPGQGMVAGPRARVAWRILDAQYFGVPQRRERVFLVADFGNGADPAEILFEPQGLRGNSAPRRETGKGIAAPIGAGAPGGSGYRNDADISENLIASAVSAPVTGNPYGDHESRETLLIAHALNAKGGSGRSDFESETFVATSETSGTLNISVARGTGQGNETDFLIAHALRAEGFDASEDGSGRGTPIVPVGFRISSNVGAWETGDRVDALTTGTDQSAHLVAFTCKDHGADAGEIAPTLRSMGFDESHANGGGQVAVAFDTTQITSKTNRSNPQPGDPCHPLAVGNHPPAVAFDLRGRAGGAQFEGPHDTANIRAASGGSSRSYVAQRWAVRRLTPTECERLQGAPDRHTMIAWRGKSAAECPDGPRYKALGNSWAVPVVAWIGARFAASLAKQRARR